MTNPFHKVAFSGGQSILFFSVLFFLAFPAQAAAVRDTSFGTNGQVQINFGGTMDYVGAAVLQPDGKIVIVGSTYSSGSFTGNFAVIRLNPNGSLDNTFGGSGMVQTDFLGFDDGAASVAFQPDGKIVVGGAAQYQSAPNSVSTGFGLARYNPNGTLDTTFGMGGKVTNQFGFGYELIMRILLQADGKILAFSTAQGRNELQIPMCIAITRYNADGSLDNTFGTGGRFFIRYNETFSFTQYTEFRGAAIQPDGKLIITGEAISQKPFCVSSPTNSCDEFVSFMFRYKPDMTFDRKFGRRIGKEYGHFNQFWEVSAEPNGEIIVAGNNIKRYSPNGRLERSFAPAIIENVNYQIDSTARRTNGTIVGCGTWRTSSILDAAINLFGANGELIGGDKPNFGSSESCGGVLVQPDDKILMFASANVSGSVRNIFVVRYLDITQ